MRDVDLQIGTVLEAIEAHARRVEQSSAAITDPAARDAAAAAHRAELLELLDAPVARFVTFAALAALRERRPPPTHLIHELEQLVATPRPMQSATKETASMFLTVRTKKHIDFKNHGGYRFTRTAQTIELADDSPVAVAILEDQGPHGALIVQQFSDDRAALRQANAEHQAEIAQLRAELAAVNARIAGPSKGDAGDADGAGV